MEKKKKKKTILLALLLAWPISLKELEQNITLPRWQTSNKKKYFTSLDSQCELGSAHNCL